MKKSDLKPGYVVENRKGEKYIVAETKYGMIVYSPWNGFFDLKFYDEFLNQADGAKQMDIVKVYGFGDCTTACENTTSHRELLWERTDAEKLPIPINTPLNDLAKEIHDNAKAHGWYDQKRSFGEIVALCHSELSEALEEYRSGKPMAYYYPETPCKCNLNAYATDLDKWHGEKLEGIATEMIDCLIRILDWCGSEGIDVDKLVRLKHEYNKSRPYKHGGKVI